MASAAKKSDWPFFKSYDGSTTYAPFGRYGYVYSLPDIRTRYRIEQAYTSAYVGLYVTLIAVNLWDFGCHGQPWEGVAKHFSLVVALCVVIYYLSLTAHQSRGLRILSRTPSFDRCCTAAARSIPAWQIWIVQYCAILLATITVAGLQRQYQESTLHWVTAGLFIAVPVALTLLCSYILHLKQRHYAPSSDPQP